MGNACGGNEDKRQYISLNGKKVKSIHRLFNRDQIAEQRFSEFSAYLVSNSQFYSSYIREANRRAKDGEIYSNANFEFIDLRKQESFRREQIVTSLNMSVQLLENMQKDRSTLKSLFDFKDLYFITEDGFKEQADYIHQILTSFKKININYKSVNILLKNFEDLKKEYPFAVMQIQKEIPFEEQVKKRLGGFLHPYLVYDHQDVWHSLGEGKSSIKIVQFKIFLQNDKSVENNIKIDPSYYQKTYNILHLIQTQKNTQNLPGTTSLEVSMKEDRSNLVKVQQKLMAELKQSLELGKSVLIIHDSDKREHFIDLIKLVKSFMYEKIYIHEELVHDYFKNKFQKNIQEAIEPKLNILELNARSQNEISQSQKIQIKSSLTEQDKIQKLQELFSQLFKETGKKQDQLDASKDFIINLIKNILDNPSEPKFRTLKKDKKALEQNIFRFKSAVQIIEQLGFKQDANNPNLYVNNMELKYLKLYNGDIGVAYRNFTIQKK